jgi:hypothetical protein
MNFFADRAFIAEPGAVWNDGCYFSSCKRCAAVIVRSAFGKWHLPWLMNRSGPASRIGNVNSGLRSVTCRPSVTSSGVATYCVRHRGGE